MVNVDNTKKFYRKKLGVTLGIISVIGVIVSCIGGIIFHPIFGKIIERPVSFAVMGSLALFIIAYLLSEGIYQPWYSDNPKK